MSLNFLQQKSLNIAARSHFVSGMHSIGRRLATSSILSSSQGELQPIIFSVRCTPLGSWAFDLRKCMEIDDNSDDDQRATTGEAAPHP
ncbi:hypothetical protein BofuT4_uP048890.1 [Botrytis cinerea T4]|uniref:Uncharacterized protein n=1 Tax=Botryotinia fuckeliana (strain T4) TaxID=999810 RepID=G2XZI4_BOTF4|nr:hypothetical protein BofuT4_uP048890.1 [Botrytis cinerea T4]